MCKGLLLRVRRRRRQDIDSVDVPQKTDDTSTTSLKSVSETSHSMSSSCGMYQYSAEVIGMVDTVYRFQSEYLHIYSFNKL